MLLAPLTFRREPHVLPVHLCKNLIVLNRADDGRILEGQFDPVAKPRLGKHLTELVRSEHVHEVILPLEVILAEGSLYVTHQLVGIPVCPEISRLAESHDRLLVERPALSMLVDVLLVHRELNLHSLVEQTILVNRPQKRIRRHRIEREDVEPNARLLRFGGMVELYPGPRVLDDADEHGVRIALLVQVGLWDKVGGQLLLGVLDEEVVVRPRNSNVYVVVPGDEPLMPDGTQQRASKREVSKAMPPADVRHAAVHVKLDFLNLGKSHSR